MKRARSTARRTIEGRGQIEDQDQDQDQEQINTKEERLSGSERIKRIQSFPFSQVCGERLLESPRKPNPVAVSASSVSSARSFFLLLICT
jgi:hypothetical protein